MPRWLGMLWMMAATVVMPVAPALAQEPDQPASPQVAVEATPDGAAVEEVVVADPLRFLRDAPKPKPITPPSPGDIEAAIRRGVDFMVAIQNPNGSWGSALRTKALNIYAPVPGAHDGYRLATTALGIWALIDVGDTRPEVIAALDKAEAHLLDKLPELKRSSADVLYNVWAHAYGIQALVRMRERHKEDEVRRARIDEVIRQQIAELVKYETVGGGWSYYDFRLGSKKPGGESFSFTSATVLVALAEARDAGFEVPEEISRRGVESIKRQQKPDFSYLYAEYLWSQPMRGINRPQGSLARSPACNLALRMWGDEQITDDVVKIWLDWLYAKNAWLDIARKRPRPHESWYENSGYFFYYGHLYAGLCIELLPVEERGHFQAHEADILLNLQEKDGSWWDYPLYDYHQQYGTAMALITLHRCRAAD